MRIIGTVAAAAALALPICAAGTAHADCGPHDSVCTAPEMRYLQTLQNADIDISGDKASNAINVGTQVCKDMRSGADDFAEANKLRQQAQLTLQQAYVIEIGAINLCQREIGGSSPQAVPNMRNDAVLGQSCSNWQRYIFGYDANGNVLACAVAVNNGIWVKAAPLYGVQHIGAPCNLGGSGGAAQSPDGLGLICGDTVWEPGP